MWHPLSIAQCDGTSFTVFLKVIEHPKAWSRALRACQLDTTHFSFLGPYGRDLLACSRAYSTLVLVAGGIGITPLMALAAAIRSRHRLGGASPQDVTLVWSSKDFTLLSLMNPLLAALADLPTVTFQVSLNFTGSGFASETPEAVPQKSLDSWPVHPGKRSIWSTLVSSLVGTAGYAAAAWLCHVLIGGDEGDAEQRAGILWDTVKRLAELLGAVTASASCAALCSWLGSTHMLKQRSPLAQQDMWLTTDAGVAPPEGTTEATVPIFPGRPELQGLLLEASNTNRGGPIGVFTCGPSEMVAALEKFTAKHSQFHLYTEAFSF
eukprot:GGOE01038197.1.p1 GENE.GGOE01038197.1~~GGOE01038197.1.p1  ORF type:complete len:336 (+),score=84.46 GGOE01038197.1:43-1008(+)